MLACSLVIVPLKTEETNESYLKKLWHSFTKKMNTIAQYGDETYTGPFCIGSMISVATGLKLWLDHNRIVERLVLDSNGDVISNKLEFVAWLQKIAVNKEEIAKIALGARFTKAKFISNTGESFTYAVETKLEPFSSSLEYKIMLGIFGVTALVALYSAYKLLTTQDKPSEVTQEN